MPESDAGETQSRHGVVTHLSQVGLALDGDLLGHGGVGVVTVGHNGVPAHGAAELVGVVAGGPILLAA